MLLLFASCLNCSVHGAFLFCGEKLLQFIVKYKAVSVRAGGQWHFGPACQENPLGHSWHFRKSWKTEIFGSAVIQGTPLAVEQTLCVHLWEMCLAGLCVCL